MKSKITSLAVVLACLSQGAAQVKSQQPFGAGAHPAYPAMPPGGMTAGYPPGMPGQAMLPRQAATMPAGYPAAYPAGPAMQALPPGSYHPGNPGPAGYGPSGYRAAGYGQPGFGHPGYGPQMMGGGLMPAQHAVPAPMPAGGNLPSEGSIMAHQPMPMSMGSEYPSGMPMGEMPTSEMPMGDYATSPMPSAGPTLHGGGCTDSEGCTSCNACDDCGDPSCACDCGGGGLFADLFGGHGSGHGGGLGSHLFGDTGPVRPARIWGGVEYLYWWNQQRSVPPLVTTSPAGTPFANAGVLGLPTTTVLFGGEYDDDPESGVRGTLGFWFDQRQTIGVFGRAFQLGEEEINFSAASTGTPILAQPFFNADLNQEGSLLVAYPGIARGQINVGTTNEIQGYDVLMRKLLYYGNCNRIDFVGGYHSTQVDDSVQVAHTLVSLDPQGRVPVGTEISTLDSFRAENEFHGGSVGVMAQGYDGRLTWNLLTKVSFGNTRQTVSINGTSTTTIPGAGSATFDQGLLALDTNSGVFEQDEFTIVPELDLSVMYHLTSNLQVSIGYSAIVWTNVALAGDAIDLTINPTQIGGPLIGAARPAYTLQDGSFWAQGLTFGVHGRF